MVTGASEAAGLRGGQPALVGALVRRVPVRVIDFSADGCLLATPATVDVGTVGHLDVMLGDELCVHAVRVCRTVRLEGRAWSHRFGAQLLMMGRQRVRRPGVEPGSGPHSPSSADE